LGGWRGQASGSKHCTWGILLLGLVWFGLVSFGLILFRLKRIEEEEEEEKEEGEERTFVDCFDHVHSMEVERLF